MSKNIIIPQNTKDFIKHHAVLIDAMQFNRFFEDAWDELYIFEYMALLSIIKNIGIDVLQYMHYIPQYFFVDSNIKTYTVTELITVIKEYAFARCTKLQTIELPKSVKKIKDSAFHMCTHLSTINYNGTKEDWKKIKIHPAGNSVLFNSIKINCIDGTIESE